MSIFLVTGAAGFIGSNLARALLQAGHTVRGIDNFATGRPQNVADLPALDLVRGDINDAEKLRPICAGVDFVLHHAAMVSVPQSLGAPLDCHHVNATGTLNVFEAARQAGVKRVVYAASSAAYGDTVQLPQNEDMLPRPLSPYGASKLMGEYYARLYSQLYGLPCVALRYFNVFGAHQDPASRYAAVIPIFVRHMLAGQAPPVEGDGLQTRDFTHVDDVVQANILACSAPGAGGGVFNIARGEATRLLDLVATLNALLGTHLAPRFLPARPGDIHDSVADISRARQILQFAPSRSLHEGLALALGWYRTLPAGLTPAPLPSHNPLK